MPHTPCGRQCLELFTTVTPQLLRHMCILTLHFTYLYRNDEGCSKIFPGCLNKSEYESFIPTPYNRTEFQNPIVCDTTFPLVSQLKFEYTQTHLRKKLKSISVCYSTFLVSDLMLSCVACDLLSTEPQKGNDAVREELIQVTCVIPSCLSLSATGRWNQNSCGASVCTIISGTKVTQNVHGCPVVSSVISSCCIY